MGKIKTWWAAHRPTTRRLAQVYCALLYNAHLKGFVEGKIYTGPLKNACVPGLNCYSCPGAAFACPLGALQNAVSASGARAGTYVLGILMLYGLILGRTICGWLCPFGLIQELLHKIPTPKIPKGRVTKALSYLKYILLAVFVVLLPLWYAASQGLPVPAFCKFICPAGTLEGAGGLLAHPNNSYLFSMLGVLFTRKAVILVLVVVICIFCFRAFCRFICPLGAIYSLFCKVAILGVKVDDSACIHCDACVRHCQMDVKKVGDHECIHCGSCMDICPVNAISIKAGKVVLAAPEAKTGLSADPVFEKQKKARQAARRIAWALALVILTAVILYSNGVLS